MKKIVLIGAGGHCKVVIDIIKSTNKYEIIGITDRNVEKNNLLDIPILGDDSILESLYKKGIKHAFICIGALGDLKIRNIIYDRLKKIGFNIPVLIHKKAIVSPHSNIKSGTCVMAGAIVNSGVTIEENCIINTGSIIEHDCIIKNNVHISPKVALGGNTIIGENTHIGIGATVIHGIYIEKNVTVGAGAVVIRNIKSDNTVVGIPAENIKRK